MKKFKLLGAILFLVGLGLALGLLVSRSKAEQSGSSPESGATSRLKATYTSINSLSYGSESAGSWGDWGTYWNRIRSAGEWTPSGNGAVGDVRTGKTFYGSSRTQTTGTLSGASVAACSTQQYHDSHASATQANNCTSNITWSDPGDSITGTDKKDGNTTLIWSQYLKNNAGTVEFAASGGSTWNWNGSIVFTVTAANATAGATYTNNGQTFTVVTTIVAGTSLNATATGSPAASGTLTKASGTGDATITFSATAAGTNNVAVGMKTATQLCSERGSGWRLPTEKELMQAYIDGSYWNLTNPANYFWSFTEYDATSAWYVYLSNGTTYTNYKATNAFYVRCVR